MIDEILTFCSLESFWDAYDVDAVYEEAGTWYARIRMDIKHWRTSQPFMKAAVVF